MATQTSNAPKTRPAPAAAVDTAKVSGRRNLRYGSLDEILADVEKLRGGYQQLGNWSLGQVAKHVAGGMSMALDSGTPLANPIVRFIAGTFMKNGAVRGPLKPGFKLPKKFAAKFIPSATADEAGVADLQKAIARWKSESQRYPHPFFGKLTAAEWDALTLNHAALHFSFLVPR